MQNPLVLSHDRRWILAANAGSDQVSVLRARPGGLKVNSRSC
jgi:hypothetical protein